MKDGKLKNQRVHACIDMTSLLKWGKEEKCYEITDVRKKRRGISCYQTGKTELGGLEFTEETSRITEEFIRAKSIEKKRKPKIYYK